MKRRKIAEEIGIAVFFILWVIVFVTGLFLLEYEERSKVEVETYTVSCEITQMAYAEEAVGKQSSKEVYKMGLRNDDLAVTLNINDTDFARYVVGEVVEVQVTVWETYTGAIEYEYELVG